MNFVSNILSNPESALRFVVLRRRKSRTEQDHSEKEVVNALTKLGYESEELIESFSIGLSSEPEEVIFLILKNEAEKSQICLDSRLIEIGITVNSLVDLNGMHLRDANDLLKIVSIDQKVTDSDLMDILTELICLEDPEREKTAEEEVKIIRKGISDVIENGVCTMFGSYPSLVRRNGYSDIDMAVSSESRNTLSVRPLQMIIDNPKCLLENPMTNAEFYSYPQVEIIKAISNCLVDREEFRENFEMRTLLVRTPIVIFKSTKNPEMKMSYDISVNNQISVEKARILNDFIAKDKSGKMRKVSMFIIHWAKTNKLLGGVYNDEKLETKLKFNTYIINHLIIHFTQKAAKKCLVYPFEKLENRLIDYEFDEIFKGYSGFLGQFFKYFMNFDYETSGIFGFEVIEKSKLSEMQGVNTSPLMMIDPLDITHNISGYITEDGVKIFKNLMKSSFEKVENSKFQATDLL